MAARIIVGSVTLHRVDDFKCIAKAIVHIFNHAMMKGGIFLALGCMMYRTGSVELSALHGLGRRMPFTMAALIIGGAELDENFARAAGNIRGMDVLPQIGANVYDILRRDTLVLTKDAAEQLQERLK